MPQTTETSVRLPLTGPFDLDATLSMGQTFFWRPVDGGHVGTVAGRVLRVCVDGSGLYVDGDGHVADVARAYFDSDRDLPALHSELSRDAFVAEAIALYPGLRVLRQPFWECLAAFILSTVNNVPRITKIVSRLSERLGTEQRVSGCSMHTFPQPERLFDLPLETLYDCGSGFRAKALRGAARAVASGFLNAEELRAIPLVEARARLTELHGVGTKVADCVLLYSLDHDGACPLDVWMCRELRRLYFDGRDVPTREIEGFVQDHFGAHAGYAQLYLYHSARHRRAGQG